MTDAQLYPSNPESDELSVLMSQYVPLIKRIGMQIKSNMPDSIDLDDLIQSGALGLLEAKASYNPQYGASFKTYATMKIRYAIYDGIRKHTNISREISQDIKKISAAMSKIEHHKSSNISAVAETMGVTPQKYSEMTKSINAYKTISIEELPSENALLDDSPQDPIFHTSDTQIKSKLSAVLKDLPIREQRILALYYNEFLNFKEIGEILELTEARVSQIHSQLLSKLKDKLTAMRISSNDIFLGNN